MRTIFAETSSGRWTNIADLGLGQNELWKAIDGCRLRYRRSPVRVVCDDPYWALLATYVLGDGDLARNSQVRFYDNEKATLNTIRDMFSEKYGYSFPNPVYEENQYGRGQWVIRHRHAAIHFILTEYFAVPIGRKKLTRRSTREWPRTKIRRSNLRPWQVHSQATGTSIVIGQAGDFQ